MIIEQLLPEDTSLRKADMAVDFNFIYDLCASLYSIRGCLTFETAPF